MHRYIVVQDHPSNAPHEGKYFGPQISIFASKQRAVECANESPNECRIFQFGSDLAPVEIKATELVKP